MQKPVFMMPQNTKINNTHTYTQYLYCVQFADGPMSREIGDVCRITHLSPLAFEAATSSESLFFVAALYIVIRAVFMLLVGKLCT
jgi:hypothetical protein